MNYQRRIILLNHKASEVKLLPETHLDNSTDENEFAVPSIVLAPEEDSRADASLYEDTAVDAENNNNSELVVHEEGDDDLNIDGILEDISVCVNDKIDYNHFVI